MFMYLSLFLGVAMSGVLSASCPIGYTQLIPSVNKCYVYYNGSANGFTNSLSFTDAEIKCRNYVGGHLASTENAFLTQAISEFIGDTSIWLGVQFNGAVWNWLNGAKYSYTNWGRLQPATNGNGFTQFGCVQQTAGLWYISDCNVLLPFLCEVPMSS